MEPQLLGHLRITWQVVEPTIHRPVAIPVVEFLEAEGTPLSPPRPTWINPEELSTERLPPHWPLGLRRRAMWDGILRPCVPKELLETTTSPPPRAR